MGARKFSSAEKAAVVLLALGEEVGGQIMAEMGEAEVRRVAEALARLGRVDQDTVDEVLVEFSGRLDSPQRFVEGNSGTARRLLENALAKGGVEVDLGRTLDLASPALRETLAGIDVKVLEAYLKRELPQTMVLVIAHLDARKAGELLKAIPDGLRTDLIVRLAQLGPVEPEILYDLEAALRQEAQRAGRTRHAVGGPNKVAALLNSLGREQSDTLLERLEEAQPDLAEEVRREMFTFADLVKLDDRGMQELLKVVPAEALRLALRKAPHPVELKIFANLSSRARGILQDDLQTMPKVKVSDVEAAQRQIAELAQKLADGGKIEIRRGDEKYV